MTAPGDEHPARATVLAKIRGGFLSSPAQITEEHPDVTVHVAKHWLRIGRYGYDKRPTTAADRPPKGFDLREHDPRFRCPACYCPSPHPTCAACGTIINPLLLVQS